MDTNYGSGASDKDASESDQKLVNYAFNILNSTTNSDENSYLDDQRAKIYDYYMGKPFGNEQPNRSKIISRDVTETVEWIMPQLMKVFNSPESIVKFLPDSPDDVNIAKQASDYVNFVFNRKNPGYKVMHDQIKSALLWRRGVVEVRYDETREYEPVEIDVLNEEEFVTLYNKPEIELEEWDEQFVGGDVIPSEEKVYSNIRGKRITESGKIVVENISPHEFIINEDATSCEDATLIGRGRYLTISEIHELTGDDTIERDDLKQPGTGTNQSTLPLTNNPVYRAQHDDRGYGTASNKEIFQPSTYDEAGEEYFMVYDLYFNYDYDGDNKAELRRVAFCNSKVLFNEEVASHGYTIWSPIQIPHLYEGLSPADLVMDIQKTKSALLRNILDNTYNVTYGRWRVTRGEVDVRSLIHGRPGDAVVTEAPDSISRLDTPPLPDHVMGLTQYLDSVKDERTGIDRTNKGQNERALRSNVPANSVSQLMAAGTSRIELMAQLYAETGLKPLFNKIFQLCKLNVTEDNLVDLQDNWTTVKPSEWGGLKTAYISINLNNINKEQMLFRLQGFAQLYEMIGKSDYAEQLITPSNMYHYGMTYAKALGLSNFLDLLTNPEAPQPAQHPLGQQQGGQQAQQDPAAMKAQADMAKVQADVQAKQMEAQTQQVEAQIKMGELQLKQQELALKEKELQLRVMELQVKAEDSNLTSAIKLEELELEKVQERDVTLSSSRKS